MQSVFPIDLQYFRQPIVPAILLFEFFQTKVEKKKPKKVTFKNLEIRKRAWDTQLVAENIANQLERRIAFRRAMKKSIAAAFRFGAKGIKIRCSGRLAGADIARQQTYL